eukprot:11249442-Prorocentrum_lima.AAC.1
MGRCSKSSGPPSAAQACRGSLVTPTTSWDRVQGLRWGLPLQHCPCDPLRPCLLARKRTMTRLRWWVVF